jgi:hypothetical protein
MPSTIRGSPVRSCAYAANSVWWETATGSPSQHALDRVVVGDGREVHPAPFGEGVDLLGRGRALGQAERSLDGEADDR